MKCTQARWRRMLRTSAGGIAGAVLLASVVSGCTTVRSDLGTSDSSCYLALPTATKAVDAHGRMIGVRRLTLSTLRRQAPSLSAGLGTTRAASQVVCAVAFEGRYTQASVSQPYGQSSGHLAVVVSTNPGNHLLGTFLFTRLPLHFGHPHFG